MALPETELLRVIGLLGIFCEERTEETVILEYTVRGNRVTLTESRPLFIDPGIWNRVNVAQFEYDQENRIWILYWYDRRNRRQPYPTGRNRDTLEKLMVELVNDPTGIFWD